jgi:Holliday junction DNA helicase RuvA
MIAKLSGILDSVRLDSLILDVGGVGYLVHASPRTLSRIGDVGAPLSLLIDTQIREDAFNLYGFADQAEQEWFRLLIGVQGVGAKAAMAILGVTPPDKLGFAIAAADKTALTRADGVGPKLATRILTELKDKAAKLDLSAGAAKGVKMQPSAGGVVIEGDEGMQSDAVSALVNLGYARTDAYSAVLRASEKSNDNSTLNDLIKVALKELTL